MRTARSTVSVCVAVFVAMAASFTPVSAQAQSVAYSGHMGDRALLVINGSPKTLAPGGEFAGVRLVNANPGSATVEIAGKRQTLTLGASPVNLSGVNSPGGGAQIVLTAGLGGHFVTGGSINGKPVQFMVDTGASVVALSEADAGRIGLEFKNNPRFMVNTANGQVPAHSATIDVIRVGDVQVYNIEAVVVPASMPNVLLGNSFLTRFQMKRENDRMTLDKRP